MYLLLSTSVNFSLGGRGVWTCPVELRLPVPLQYKLRTLNSLSTHTVRAFPGWSISTQLPTKTQSNSDANLKVSTTDREVATYGFETRIYPQFDERG